MTSPRGIRATESCEPKMWERKGCFSGSVWENSQRTQALESFGVGGNGKHIRLLPWQIHHFDHLYPGPKRVSRNGESPPSQRLSFCPLPPYLPVPGLFCSLQQKFPAGSMLLRTLIQFIMSVLLWTHFLILLRKLNISCSEDVCLCGFPMQQHLLMPVNVFFLSCSLLL